MYFCRKVSSFLRKLLPLFSLRLYHVQHRWQHQHPLKCKILVCCRSVANDSKLLGCNTAVICSVVTSVSKDHSAFIYKVWQYLNPKFYGPLKHWELHNQQQQNAPLDLNLLPTYWYLSIKLHGIMCQTAVHWALTTVRNLILIYVNNIIYKQHFHQIIQHVMRQSTVKNPTLPPKHSWTIKLTAVYSQWLLKSV